MPEATAVAAPGTTAAPNGAPPQAGANAAPAPAPAPWYGDLSTDPDLKGYAELKAFKTPADALKHARQTEQFVGTPKDLLLKLPKPDADAKAHEEAMGEIYNRLGRPATPAEYKIPAIEGDEASAKFTETMKPILHGIGLSQDQAAKLKTAWDGYIQNEVKAADAARAQQEQLDLTNLHREWPGDVYTQREEMARRAVRTFVNPMVGADQGKAEELLGKIEDSIGTAQFLKLFSSIGEKTGEASFVGDSRPSGFGMTPAAAQAQLEAYKQDRDWTAAVLAKKQPQFGEWERLVTLGAQAPRG